MTEFMKWLGGGLGWAAGGPVGAVLGFMFGSIIDGVTSPDFLKDDKQKGRSRTTQGDFMTSLLLLSAAVIKADKKVMRSELDYVKDYLISNFPAYQVNEQLQFLKTALEHEYDIQPSARQISRYMGYPAKLQLLHFMFGISLADGILHPSELNLITTLAATLGINQADFDSIKAMFVKSTTSAYTILEVVPGASDEEVKKAYRRMAVKYHPDKVAHLGDDIQKAAQKKFQEVQQAWNSIKKERNII